MKKLIVTISMLCLLLSNVVPFTVFAVESKPPTAVPALNYTKEELALGLYEAAVQYLEVNSVSILESLTEENDLEQVYVDKLQAQFGQRLDNQ
ncbi:MAG: hypothetical protein ACRCWQ_15070, partial [Bacilli bacterium]